MRLRVTEYRRPYAHRVVQPRTPLRHTSLTAPDPIGLLLGDHDGLNRLAALFSFAACSRHTVVHVPLRDGVPLDEGQGERVDLVPAHRTLGLCPSQWPGLRRRLRQGTPLTVRTDEARTARYARVWQETAGDRNELRHVTHARTLFLLGSREVFADSAVALAHAAGFGPRQQGVVKGHSALMPGLALAQPPGGGHPYEVLVCFKPYPPYAHFRRPGKSATRRCPSAAPS